MFEIVTRGLGDLERIVTRGYESFVAEAIVEGRPRHMVRRGGSGRRQVIEKSWVRFTIRLVSVNDVSLQDPPVMTHEFTEDETQGAMIEASMVRSELARRIAVEAILVSTGTIPNATDIEVQSIETKPMGDDTHMTVRFKRPKG